MNKNRKTLLGLILVALVVVAGYFVWRSDQEKTPEDKEKIKIGVILPLTGELSNFGKTVLDGISLCVTEFEMKHPEFSIQLVLGDSKGTVKDAVNAFNHIRLDKTISFFIGDLTSSGTIAINELAKGGDVLLMSPTASHRTLSKSNPYFFRVWQSDNYDAKLAASYCFNNLGMRSMGIVYLNTDYCVGLMQEFQSNFEQQGGKIVLKAGGDITKNEWRTDILRLKALNVDGVYLPAHPIGIATFLKQSDELNFRPYFFSNVASEDKDFLSIAGKSANGLFFTAPTMNANDTNVILEDFKKRYLSRYNENPDIHSVKGYESMLILTKGIAAGCNNAKKMRRFIIDKQKFDGISGSLIFNEDGDVQTGVSIKQYNKDTITILANYSKIP